MNKYKVYIQDKFYKEIVAENTGDVLATVSKDIQNNLVEFYDHSKNSNIRIENVVS